MSQDLMTFLLTSICSTHYYKNPYLVSRILEVLYVINPSILESAEALDARFMSHPISEEYLPSALMKFYTGRMASKIIYLTFFNDVTNNLHTVYNGSMNSFPTWITSISGLILS